MPAWASRIIERQYRQQPHMRRAIARARRIAHSPPIKQITQDESIET